MEPDDDGKVDFPPLSNEAEIKLQRIASILGISEDEALDIAINRYLDLQDEMRAYFKKLEEEF